MSLQVIGFYRRTKNKNPFTTTLIDPIFYVLVSRNKKVREFTLKLSGKFSYVIPSDLKFFDTEAYRNYIIITDFLLGENRDKIRANWGLSTKEYRDLIFQLYFVLIKNHAKYGWFKKEVLVFLGKLKYYFGRRRV